MGSESTGAPTTRGIVDAPNATYAFAMAFFEELLRCGVTQVCISPGSRSTPLAIAAASVPGMRAWSHLDERASAFFALGLAKATRNPVALVCTSGTALANYLPAVIEAHYAGVPLVVSSADRPPELRETGAGQTIDQVKIFGAQVRFFAELPVPEAGPSMLRYARTMACRAVAESGGANPGPVHLNWPLREPLEPVRIESAISRSQPDRVAEQGRSQGQPYVRRESELPQARTSQVEDLATLFRAAERGVIACGVMDEPGFAPAVTRLAELIGWPLLAEPTAGLRSGGHTAAAPIVAGSDLFLRAPSFKASYVPQVVLRFGGTPLSKAFRLWIEDARVERLVLVTSRGDWNEPSHLASDFVFADPAGFCNQLCEAIERRGSLSREGRWLAAFLDAEARTQAVIENRLREEPALLEPRATRKLCELLPDDSLLYVSNSMPVRDLDAFMPTGTAPLRVLSNRGANGIDGIVSSALGAAAAERGHVFLLTGDLAFLYDVGGLLAAQRYTLRATIIVLNNDGGGIFSFLPVAEYAQSVPFDELFTTPHGVDLAAVAPLYGLSHTRVADWNEYTVAIGKSLSHPGVTVIEVPVDREVNLGHFRSLVRAVSRAVDAEGGTA
ncbi:MAG: 2-succinyl-5-enolpyruvyl-6-hydroxy-3-cyclohexene-1-carboxylic-acid synthase [bacterium]|nr:2-succinyl-5-enolpyruvyl-6-hydroxy-3-cyclohexene-1-carboxylic-acid synthase [bacterium]